VSTERAPDLAAGRHAAWAFLAVMVLVAALVRIDVDVPLVGHLGAALVAVTFLYAPSVVAWRRREDLVDYGFRLAPVGRGLGIAAVFVLGVLPLFVAGYVLFFHQVCGRGALAHLAPPGVCLRWIGWAGAHVRHLGWDSVEFVLVQVVVVALTEELFFRGCLLELLERRFPPKRRILGGGVGLALVLSSAAFAVVHIPKYGDVRELVKFFPGLLFGWMRSATGSILPSTIAHASSNIVIRALEVTLFR